MAVEPNALHEQAALAAQITFGTGPIAPAAGNARAVIVIHGMGQQLPFETLDAVANGLYREDIRRHGRPGVQNANVSHVQFGGTGLERVEMRLRTATGTHQEVHLYETYWAPLTEGAVTLRDVLRFLFAGGIDGFKNGLGVFRQWIFGQLKLRYVSPQTPLYFLTAIGVVVSLILANAAIIPVVAAQSPFGRPPRWPSPHLIQDLSDVFNATLIVLEAFAVSIFASVLLSQSKILLGVGLFGKLRRWLALLVGVVSIPLLGAAICAVLSAGIASLILYGLHKGVEVDVQPLVPSWIHNIGQMTATINVALIGVVGVVAVGYVISSVARGFAREVLQSPIAAVTSTIVIVLLLAIAYGVIQITRALLPASFLTTELLRNRGGLSALTWPLLIVASLTVRMFLVQYVGDVAAYVDSHTLDRFFELRTKIKDTVRKTVEAIYAQQSNETEFDYTEIVITGHSLGSVIAYDTLNRLLLDDASALPPGPARDTKGRTKLLLTFGSPLNKTAFLFSTQSKKLSMTDARARLATLVQPLIDSPAVRAGIRWINIYSPWDLISGRLDFYDVPGEGVPRVQNERDPEAVTLLGAHTEYWRNWLLFERLHQAVA
jgi:hypothetical protein